VTARYKIIGTIHVDPHQSDWAIPFPLDSAPENVLLSLAVTDALSAPRGGHERHRGLAWPGVADFHAAIPADLNVLLAELQREWEELEIV
jgi:hypothetical protein